MIGFILLFVLVIVIGLLFPPVNRGPYGYGNGYGYGYGPPPPRDGLSLNLSNDTLGSTYNWITGKNTNKNK
jgi:hypothetical protein